MKYLVINKLKAVDIGLHADHYRKSKDGMQIIINENDLMNSFATGETLHDRAEILGIKLLSITELKQEINTGGW